MWVTGIRTVTTHVCYDTTDLHRVRESPFIPGASVISVARYRVRGTAAVECESACMIRVIDVVKTQRVTLNGVVRSFVSVQKFHSRTCETID